LGLYVFEGVLYVEHGGVVHVQEGVEHLLLVICVVVHEGVGFALVAGVQEFFGVDEFEQVEFFPFVGIGLLFRSVGLAVELKAFEFEVELVFEEVFDALYVYFVEFGDEAGGDEAVFESEAYVLGGGEDELVEVVEDEFEGFGVGFVDLDDLRDAAGVEGLVLYVTEVAEYLLDFVLH
jgi:hypothetical protein